VLLFLVKAPTSRGRGARAKRQILQSCDLGHVVRAAGKRSLDGWPVLRIGVGVRIRFISNASSLSDGCYSKTREAVYSLNAQIVAGYRLLLCGYVTATVFYKN
jgi:hypothetical protein